MTANATLEAAPKRLVDDGEQRWGRFATPFERANLLDSRYRGLPKLLRKVRMKEWQALQITTPGLFANVALFDAKLMSLLQVKVYEREKSKKAIHEWKLRPGAFSVADQLLDSTNTYGDRRGFVTFTNELARGRITLDFDVAARDELPHVKGHVEVLCDRGASQVVSMPFETAGGMYSHKGMFPIEGAIEIDGRRYALRPEDSLALLDDHKGFYPFVMQWDWVTSATHVKGEALGFNLTKNQCREPERFNENCAWRGDRLGVLPAVTFEREDVRGPNERWRIRDREGRVDVTFRPTVPGDVRVNAVVVESRYRGPFGIFDGRVEPEGLEPIVIDGWFGMGEDFYLRC